ncbi:MAG: mannose-1-phosphate guanylyltransferase/mannose-6-phosphate isomerase [Gammaproteobacteria bacterium]|nr:mannose-1-phosphate guanylyltransferase/mannose-6-phosphate isomerase [Rhodocyclaceae bacterium]MBU3910094.1 mannose-1-phosphate guanylyltransferase/mannose-6-phosphate isomerase [Gammaproteobacteria bacterium]MBU3990106.1 mannose-1-phosphate guanylyltransferase/mannose-6-phosphate isomerase [Gammaproteobacteria bacterium]MBU4006102.1 mannose-1-phosphate guanylyltransferase/mannose-6-phosphate isomerase [Gammaproteobacteria bacterium]MBU4022556.1 mannose-1-phosphate guanylyltransferase/manno
MLIPIILSGGAGTRLWPVSRAGHPKPFIQLPDGQSLLQKTALRAAAVGDGRVLTVTNRDHYFLTRDEYAGIEFPQPVQFDYLLEPAGRNTAPAIAAAALALRQQFGDDAIMLVLPADHLIEDAAAFRAAVDCARALAETGWLVTFGIPPTSPETGFGYIEAGPAQDDAPPARVVACFIEKPPVELAQEYVTSGRHFWNSGMFCFRVGDILNAMSVYAPEVANAVNDCWAATATDQLPVTLDADTFGHVPDISIDYAVMEKAGRVAVVPVAFDWSDIGSWSALADIVAADDNGNRILGEALLVDAGNCYINAPNRIVAGIGINDLLIVDTPDALLVAHRDQAQEVKQIVGQLKRQGHATVNLHRTVFRPWGSYTILEEGPRFKIKRIVVKPGASLSLQMHHHRSEHWVVVSGTAQVTNGEREILVKTDESSYIPAGTQHRLSNPGVIDCVMIEVQSGDYLGEDDIVRMEDIYGRG